MSYDERLARRIRAAFAAHSEITERKMFGGIAFLYRGRMCCGVVGSDLMVRIPEREIAAVMRWRHVRPMDFTGTLLRGFAYVSPAGLRTDAALRMWRLVGEQVTAEKAAGRMMRRGSGSGEQRRARATSRTRRR